MVRRIPLAFLLSLSALTTACVIQQQIIAPPGYAPYPVGIAGGSGLRATVSQLVLAVGDERDLTTWLRTAEGVLPTQSLVWKTNDPSVVMTLNPTSGRVKALSPGTTVVTAFTSTGEPTSGASIEVSVVEKLLVQSITIRPSAIQLMPGSSARAQAQVQLPDGQINGNVNWSSSDNTIATVNATTGEITALREGKVTIVASYALEPRYKGITEVTVGADVPVMVRPLPPGPIVVGPSPVPTPYFSPTPTPPGASQPNGPVDLELGTLVIKEMTGNNDGVANRGETLYLRPTLVNRGAGASGDLKVKLRTSAPADVAQVYGPESVSLFSTAGGASYDWRGVNGLGLRLGRSAGPGTKIAVSFEVTDARGNAWTLPAVVECAPIDNHLVLQGVEFVETVGNQDGVANRGETLSLRPRLLNQGGSSTNDLTVRLETTVAAEVAQVAAPAYVSLAPIAGGASGAGAEGLGLRIAETAPAGAQIPLIFKVQDAFGNAWEVQTSLRVP